MNGVGETAISAGELAAVVVLDARQETASGVRRRPDTPDTP